MESSCLVKGFVVAIPSSIGPNKTIELNWIIDRARENRSKGMNTYIVVTYDVLDPKDLGEIVGHRVFHVRILKGAQTGSTRDLFGRENAKCILLDDSPWDLGRFITTVCEQAEKASIPTEIILYNLSWLIETHSHDILFKLLTEKIPVLKARNTCVTAFFYPDIHPAEITNKFLRLADEIIKIGSED